MTGFELDVFTNLDEKGSTNHQIAKNLHLDEHACERLLNALVSLGFLTKQDHLFFQELIIKCFNALNKNGKIVIQDWIMNNDRTQPTSGAVFAINMLVGTESGDCCTEQEVAEMLTAAGFNNISRIEFESGSGQMMAQKT